MAWCVGRFGPLCGPRCLGYGYLTSLEALIASDALAALSLGVAAIIHGRWNARRYTEARQSALRRFASSEIDIAAYERAVEELADRHRDLAHLRLLLGR